MKNPPPFNGWGACVARSPRGRLLTQSIAIRGRIARDHPEGIDAPELPDSCNSLSLGSLKNDASSRSISSSVVSVDEEAAPPLERRFRRWPEMEGERTKLGVVGWTVNIPPADRNWTDIPLILMVMAISTFPIASVADTDSQRFSTDSNIEPPVALLINEMHKFTP